MRLSAAVLIVILLAGIWPVGIAAARSSRHPAAPNHPIAVQPCQMMTAGALRPAPRRGTLPSRISAPVPAAQVPALRFYAGVLYGRSITAMLAPAGLHCVISTGGADGGAFLVVSLHPQNPRTAEVSAILAPGGAGPTLALLCPYFPTAPDIPRGAPCQSRRPRHELSVQPDKTSAFFRDPPHVRNNEFPSSGGSNPTVGVVLRRPPLEADCTLPARQIALCRTILAIFLLRHKAVHPAAPSEAVALQRIPWLR